MIKLFYYFFIAVGLSMDSFSLSIFYGMKNFKKRKIIIISVIVGVFHFIMPNISSILTNYLVFDFEMYANIIAGLVFLFLCIEMLISYKDKDIKYELTGIFEIILFSFAVSLDSFSVGAALSLENENIILSGLIFSVVSAFFTFIGLNLGNKINSKVGNLSKIIGIIILFLLSLKYFLIK